MRTVPPRYVNRLTTLPPAGRLGHPVETALEELLLMNPEAEGDTGEKYQISPQDYIESVFEQLRRGRE